MNREQAYKEHPEIAAMTDFLILHKRKLEQLHKEYIKDTKEEIPFLSFVHHIYHHAQDLVLNP